MRPDHGAAGPLRAVTLDLDDTLFPQSSWLQGAWAAVADVGAGLGLDRAALHAALVAIAAEGSDRGQIIDRALSGSGGRQIHVPVLVEAFIAHAPTRLTPYPGAARALAQLHHAGLRIAVITDGNPRTQYAKLAALGLTADRRIVDLVVISDEIGGRQARKPSPVPFRHALTQLGVTAGQAVHIGDNAAKDVAGAASIGLRCIRVLTGEHATRPVAPNCPRPWRTASTFAAATRLALGSMAVPTP